MTEEELLAWQSSAGYWIDPRAPAYWLNEKNLRKQSSRVLELIAEVRRLREECDNLRLLCERMGQDEVRAGLGRDDA